MLRPACGGVELSRIGDAEELELAARRSDGSPRSLVTVYVTPMVTEPARSTTIKLVAL